MQHAGCATRIGIAPSKGQPCCAARGENKTFQDMASPGWGGTGVGFQDRPPLFHVAFQCRCAQPFGSFDLFFFCRSSSSAPIHLLPPSPSRSRRGGGRVGIAPILHCRAPQASVSLRHRKSFSLPPLLQRSAVVYPLKRCCHTADQVYAGRYDHVSRRKAQWALLPSRHADCRVV
ncbi:hypothetical protein LX36DRAFT_106268 [Colletotrichum falcatum]|nr:hypothetical protein LX36DRAFT_106268 [Colletotrichum falcatum]